MLLSVTMGHLGKASPLAGPELIESLFIIFVDGGQYLNFVRGTWISQTQVFTAQRKYLLGARWWSSE